MFGALMAAILLGLGLWTATPMGGGGLGDEGGAGQDVQDLEPGPSGGVVPQDRDGVAQDGSEGRVEIQDGRFSPATVEVPPNSVVTFINRDDVAHRVDFEDKAVKDSKEIPPGEAYVAELPREGRYKFSDPTDKAMKGTVVVSGG